MARCFRDEDLRADRQPEFTQLDLEMAFTDRDTILEIVEGMVRAVFRAAISVDLPENIPRMTYTEAMRRYGTDRPDTRFGLELTDVTEIISQRGDGEGDQTSFPPFAEAAALGSEVGAVQCIVVPNGKSISNGRLKMPKGDICSEAVAAGGKGLAFARVVEVTPGEVALEAPGKLVPSLSLAQQRSLINETGAGSGDLILFAYGSRSVTAKVLDRVRTYVAQDLDLIPAGAHHVLWVVDFPMFERNEDENRWEAMHHPFTAPIPGCDHPLEHALANAYDLVYNGVEVGGGSVRIHDADLQQRVFATIGMSKAESVNKFGFLLDALAAGAPPHAGLAFGVDRLAMLLANAKYGASQAASIRDVIAFPKTTAGGCLMTGAPTRVEGDAALTQALHEVGWAQVGGGEGEAS